MSSSIRMLRVIAWTNLVAMLMVSVPVKGDESPAPAKVSLPGEVAPLPIKGVFSMPKWSPTGEWIAASGPQQQGIYIFRPDGSEFRRVTADPGAGLGFAWSPDGTRIAHRSKRLADPPGQRRGDRSDKADQAMQKPEGTDSPDTKADSPADAQSPEPAKAETADANEGKDAATSSPTDSDLTDRPQLPQKLILSIKVLSLDGTPAATITESTGDIGFPSWVNESSLSFAAGGQACIFGLDGKVIKRGLKTNANILAWASNMARVILADRVENDRVVIVADNGDRKYLTDESEGRFYEPIVSPRGDQVLVHSLLDDHLHVINLVDGKRRDLGVGLGGRWAPESKRIACYVAKDDGHDITESDIYMIDLSDGSRVRITDTPNYQEMHPSWSPDGRSIVCGCVKTGSIFVHKVDTRGQ
ncbi:MAG: hypothetical protein GXY55_18080 [Phycisphaerae bacterium]|nr:hypothetical protein [Phycisphaerae bacterium]